MKATVQNEPFLKADDSKKVMADKRISQNIRLPAKNLNFYAVNRQIKWEIRFSAITFLESSAFTKNWPKIFRPRGDLVKNGLPRGVIEIFPGRYLPPRWAPLPVFLVFGVSQNFRFSVRGPPLHPPSRAHV